MGRELKVSTDSIGSKFSLTLTAMKVVTAHLIVSLFLLLRKPLFEIGALQAIFPVQNPRTLPSSAKREAAYQPIYPKIL